MHMQIDFALVFQESEEIKLSYKSITFNLIKGITEPYRF